jgi:hypothetical protein
VIKIEVTEETRTIPFADKKTGERKSFVVQTAWAHCPGDKYPIKVELSPPKGEAAYSAGTYVLAPESITVADGKLVVRPKLLTQSQAASRVPGKAA